MTYLEESCLSNRTLSRLQPTLCLSQIAPHCLEIKGWLCHPHMIIDSVFTVTNNLLPTTGGWLF